MTSKSAARSLAKAMEPSVMKKVERRRLANIDAARIVLQGQYPGLMREWAVLTLKNAGAALPLAVREDEEAQGTLDLEAAS